MQHKYPVVFFVFKRAATTRIFLERITAAQAEKIYIFADGPRNAAEKKATQAVRAIIEDFSASHPHIKFATSFAPHNLGLKRSVITGLGKVFAQEKAAIILEDDCLPTPDFFRFTAAMLDRYAADPRIMSVNGTCAGGNFASSYDFTKYAQCWGWATWARAWALYDPGLTTYTSAAWKELKTQLHFSLLLSWYWTQMLTLVKANWINTWDFQWSYAHLSHHGLAIAPAVNLITNIGFDAAATNTKTKTSMANRRAGKITWPLTHPLRVKENYSVSNKIESSFYTNPVAVLGLLRQCFYSAWNTYAHRT